MWVKVNKIVKDDDYGRFVERVHINVNKIIGMSRTEHMLINHIYFKNEKPSIKVFNHYDELEEWLYANMLEKAKWDYYANR